MTPKPSDSLIIKICGMTRLDDARVALNAGADWIGLIRWPGSKRYREPQAAAEMLAELRSQIDRPFQAVGVFVDASRETVEHEMKLIGLDRVQLHGNEDPTLAMALPWPVIKALRVRDVESTRAMAAKFPEVELLADAYVPGEPGGTGQSWDYSLMQELVAKRRVLIAGGLTPDNVDWVVRHLQPWGLDVASGVESQPGIKDHEKIRRFIANARSAAEALARSND